jgi:hypothetical protein
MGFRIFSSGAADATELATHEAEQRAALLALAEGCSEFKLAVVVHDGAYWPSREFVGLLAQHATLDPDVLFVNHRGGQVTR